MSVGTANMVGAVLSTMTFGFHLALLAQITRIYFARFRGQSDRGLSRRDWRLYAYVCVLCLLATVGLCLQTWANYDAFVVHSTYPGGSLAYLGQQTQHPVHTVLIMTYIALNWVADGMVLWRMYVLFQFSKAVLAVCVITMLTLIGVGSAFVRTAQVSGLSLWTNYRIAPCVAYLALSFFINFVLTLVIVARILWVRHELRKHLGRRYTSVYTSIAAMLVESAALYTVVTLVSIIACATRNPVENALLPMLGQLQAIPPLLIIVRVLEGRAVTAETWQTGFTSKPSTQGPRFNDEPKPKTLTWDIESKAFDSSSIVSFPSYGALSFSIPSIDPRTRRPSPSSGRPSLHLSIKEIPRTFDGTLSDEEWDSNARTAVEREDDEPRWGPGALGVELPASLPTAITPRCSTCSFAATQWR
ncbi:hypothetical protein C2E23DRAFT_885628 [Lenzites betulinus]|nr:hypothetical protein C2E23DRAFT_885628 [Lenzites betulinus]